MEKKPNVILMFIDDLGYGDLSCFNENSKLKTTNIDGLSDCGIRLTDCHSTSALCTPSRYGLLTGRYNWRSRLKQSVLPGGGDPLIESGRMTLASMFKKHGYYTAAVGKWHLGLGWERKALDGSEYGIADEVNEKKNLPGAEGFLLDGMNIDFTKPLKVSPNDYGFDYFFGTAASLDQPPYTYIENRTVLAVPDHVTGVFPLDRTGATQQELWQRGPAAPGYNFEKVIGDMNDKVLEIIDEHAQEPFFLYYPTHAVHGPLLPPAGFKGKSGLNVYGDMVLYLDYIVGTVRDKLQEKGILEDTIFIFASDNGCSGVADYPFLTSHGHNPSYIFRGKKTDIYEGGHRIPAIISWPGHFGTVSSDGRIGNGGAVCDQMTCLCDLFATFAQILGENLPDNAGEDSISLLPALHKNMPVRHAVVHSSGDGSFSIRTQDWKLELCRHGGSGMARPVNEPSTSDQVPYQLYNLKEDVEEQHNVAEKYPKICLDLANELLEIIKNGRSTAGQPQENAGMDSWKQLRDVYGVMEKIEENAKN